MVLAVLAGSVASGDVSAPALVAAVALGTLGVLVLPAHVRAQLARPGPADAVVVVGLTLVLAANLVVVGDLARLVGLTGAHGLVAGAAIALAVVAWRGYDALWCALGVAGAVAVITPVGLVGMAGGTPWAAWAELASRPALTFDAASTWVSRGRAFGERTTLTFAEPHRVVAVSGATWRVSEEWPPRASTREWRVAPGDALTLRPGDQLTVDRGTRVRFEAGRRIPTAAASGIAWSDGPPRSALQRLVGVVGLSVTLVLGGLALAPGAAAPPGRLSAIGMPVVAGSFVVAGALWGLYGAALVPELALVPRALAPISEAAERVGGTLWRPAAVACLAAAMAALLAGALVAWRIRVIEALRAVTTAAGRAEPAHGAFAAMAAGLVVAGAVVGLRDDDPWNLLALGLGLVASTAVVPRLAAREPRPELWGVIVGVAVFVAVASDAARWPMGALLAHHPAVVAAPAAWLAARWAGRAAR